METIIIDTPLVLGYIFSILGTVLYGTKDTVISYCISAICLFCSIFYYIQADAAEILIIITSMVLGSNIILLAQKLFEKLYNKYGKEDKDKPSD